MSSFKFTLQQQTPQIHFQGLQALSGLRASDVKPRLDKFLAQKLNDAYGFKAPANGNYKEAPYAPWLLGTKKEKAAFAYKLIIGNTPSTVIPIIKDDKQHKFSGFFGNMGLKYNDNSKYWIMATGKISCSVYPLTNVQASIGSKQLLDVMMEHIPEFFATHNFGTRQGKGYGSYMVMEPTTVHALESAYYFEVQMKRTIGHGDFEKLFSTIDLFYRTLRSGLNLKGRGQRDLLYFKSLMFQYAKSNGLQWDKKTVRHALFRNHATYQEADRKRTDQDGTFQFSSNGPKYDFRDWLGLASEQTWFNYGPQKKDGNGYDKTTVINKLHAANGAEISRVPSPILFKPVRHEGNKYRVYLLLQPLPEILKTASAAFSSKKAEKSDVVLPMFPDFMLNEYLDFAIRTFDKKQFQYPEGNEPEEVSIIGGIYDILKTQLPKK